MREDLRFTPATAADAAAVADLTARAFAARPPLQPPSPALTETADQVADELERWGGAVLRSAAGVLASVRLLAEDDVVRLRRVAVDPEHRGRGYGTRLALWTQAWIARRKLAGDFAAAERITVDVRRELPANKRFWEVLEYAVTPPRAGLPDYLLTLEREVPAALAVPDAEAMRALGGQLAALLRPGDLVMLHGDLGAGKTTLTQGLGERLGVRGAVTSPTFVIAREHPGPLPLVHVDAYRVGTGLEIDDLDLDADLDASVTVVEWGEGLVEQLAPNRLEVHIERSGADDDERRVVVVEGFGPRWRDVALPRAAQTTPG